MSTLLIVDDSKTMRLVLRRSLRQAGLEFDEIREAENGIEALAAVSSGVPSLILCDWNMPGMSGEEFLVNLRQRRDARRTPVIIVTTEGSPAVLERAKAAGATGYVKKPFDRETLVHRIGPYAN